MRAYARSEWHRIGSALSLLALLLIASAIAPRIAHAQSGERCPTITAPQEGVCNIDLSAPSVLIAGYDTTSMTNQQVAQPFTTGAAPTGYDLREAHIFHGTRRGEAGDLAVAIHDVETDGSGNVTGVGEQLGTLAGANPNAQAVFDFTTSGIYLDPETEYFLVLSATAADTSGDHHYEFPTTRLTTESGDAGWSIGDDLYLDRDNGSFIAGGGFVLPFALIAEPAATRLKLRVFLESALP